MKKDKIAVGQCYEQDDTVYEIIARNNPKNLWKVRHVITKEFLFITEQDLLKMRRPFNTEG